LSSSAGDYTPGTEEVARLHYAAWRNIKQDKLERARLLYQKALDFGDHARTFLLWALLEQRAGCPDESRRVFRAGVERHRMDPSLVQAWGLLESKLGQARCATLLLKRCCALNPESRVLRWRRIQDLSDSRESMVRASGDVVRPSWARGAGGTRASRYRHDGFVPLSQRSRDPARWIVSEVERIECCMQREREVLEREMGGGGVC